MSEINTDLAILDTHYQAENAVKVLQSSGFDAKKLSIEDQDYQVEEKNVGYYNARERMTYWCKLGVYWGAMWGLLSGPALFATLRVGFLVEAGPFVSASACGLLGAVVVGCLGSFFAGLYSFCVPKDSIVTYETALKSEKFVLVVHGSAEELTHANRILRNMGHVLRVQAA